MVQCFSLEAPTRALSGETNAYVVGREDGLLIDPATRQPALDAVVEAQVGHVAVTHHHPDHVSGVRSYADEYDLTVWARAGRHESFESAAGMEPDRTFTPGQTIPAAGGIPVLDTPGHAPEHVAFAVSNGFVTGDLAVSEGSVVVGAPQGDMRAYLSSLRRLYARSPDRLYPGHGSIIDDPRSTCERLIKHRLDRERRVLEAIQEGNETPEEIVDAAYEKDIRAVYDLARATVIAHIEKLAHEGKVTFDDERAISTK